MPLLELPASAPADYCRRPCHDCPFRTDTPRYQTVQNVASNIECTVNPELVAICHNTVAPYCKRKVIKPRVCAGGILFSLKLKMPKDWLEANQPTLRDFLHIYTSLDDFLLHAACPDQSYQARLQAWVDCQPVHLRQGYSDKYQSFVLL